MWFLASKYAIFNVGSFLNFGKYSFSSSDIFFKGIFAAIAPAFCNEASTSGPYINSSSSSSSPESESDSESDDDDPLDVPESLFFA